MSETEKNELLAVYRKFSDEQIYEIFLGEKEGIDFNSYARIELTAEEMKAAREALTLEKTKNTAVFECRYFSSTAKELSGFYNPSELLINYLMDESLKGVSYRDVRRWAGVDGVLQGKLNRILAHLIGEREVLDATIQEEKLLPEAYAQIVKDFRFEKTLDCLWFYPGSLGKVDIYKTFGKNGQSKMKAVNLSADSAFALRDLIPGYNENYYSMGFTCEEFSFSIGVLPNNTATKAAARVELVFIDRERIYIEDANKYFDTSLLTVGLKS